MRRRSVGFQRDDDLKSTWRPDHDVVGDPVTGAKIHQQLVGGRAGDSIGPVPIELPVLDAVRVPDGDQVVAPEARQWNGGPGLVGLARSAEAKPECRDLQGRAPQDGGDDLRAVRAAREHHRVKQLLQYPLRALAIRLGPLAGGIVSYLAPSGWGVHGTWRGERLDLLPRPEVPRDGAVVEELEGGLGPVEVVLSPFSHVDGQSQAAPGLDVSLDARPVGRGPVLVELANRIGIPDLSEDVSVAGPLCAFVADHVVAIDLADHRGELAVQVAELAGVEVL